MERSFSNIIYKCRPEYTHAYLSDNDLIAMGEILAGSIYNYVPIDFLELYLFDSKLQTHLWYSSLQASDKRNNAISRKIASYISLNEEIFRFPYYDKQKYPDVHYSDFLEVGKSFIAYPLYFEGKVVGATVLASQRNQIFRDDIVPLLATQIASWEVVYKSLFAKDKLVRESMHTHYFLDHIDLPVFAVDHACKLTYSNNAFNSFIQSNFAAREIPIGEALSLMAKPDFEFLEHLIQTAWQNKKASQSQLLMIAAEEIFINFEAFRVEDEVIVFCRNEQRQQLQITGEQDSITKLHGILPFVVFVIDRNSEIVYHNQYLEQLLGINICGSSLLEFIHSSQIKNYFRLLTDWLNGDAHESQVSIILNTNKQSQVSLVGTFKKINYRNQDAIVFFGTDLFSKDVLANAHLSFSPTTLVNAIPIAVAITDEQFACTFVNKSFEQLTGKSLQEVQSFSLPDSLLPPTDAQHLIKELSQLNDKEIFTRKISITQKDGTVREAILSVASNGAAAPRYFIFSLYDITSWESEKKNILAQAQAAIDAQQAEEQFLARMSHEIRTAMNGIIGLTNVMMQSGMSGEQRQFLNLIKQSTDNLLVIINDILDLSKIKSGKLQFEQVPVQLKVLFENIYSVVASKLGAKEVHLTYDFDEEIPPLLNTDPVRINQILLNLLGNAVKFTERGQISYSAKLLSKNDDIARILIEVTDTGIGIDEKDIKHIFETYKQAHSSTTRKYGGTGLGLPIVKQLVELLGGSISVKSQLHKGTTFSIELPLKINNEKIVNEPTTAAEIKVPEGITVLVVDDNYINRLLVVHLLKSKGFTVMEAAGGYEALDLLQEEDVDVVLMDISMPDIDGFETTRIIRKSDKAYIRHIPVIAMTAHGFQDQINNAIEAGMNSYIVKPFKPEQLYQTIMEQLNISEKGGVEEELSDTITDTDSKESHSQSTYTDTSVRNYDLTFLEDYYDHEPTFINNILKLYIQDTPGMLKEMEQCLLEADWKQFKALAHKIKTNVMMMGIKPVDDFFKACSAIDISLNEHPDIQVAFYSFKLTLLNALDQIKADRGL